MQHLTGLNILVTRPAHQSQQLKTMLQQAGANPLLFPTIDIIESKQCLDSALVQKKLKTYDIALFVSQNAVEYAFKHINKIDFSKHIKFGVIGKGSLARLQQLGLSEQAIPAGTYNSEGLLASELLQHVNAKKVIIFRGQAGRNLLGDTLQTRGAQVDYCEVYQRSTPKMDDSRYHSVFSNNIDCAIFTSSDGLLQGFELFTTEDANRLLNTPWLLISERMKKTAYNLGHNSDLIIAHQASDEGMISALLDWNKN